METVSQKLRRLLTTPRKPGNTAEFDMNIEGEVIVRGKDGRIKTQQKFKKKRLFD